MEPHTALVGADGGIELNAVGIVDLHLTLVVHPGYTEQNAALGGGQPLQQGIPAVPLLILLDCRAQRLQNFRNSLMEFGLTGVLSDHSL